MQKTIMAMFLTLAMLGGNTALSMAGVELATNDPLSKVAEAICDQGRSSPMGHASGILLVAQNDNKFKCVEQCAMIRATCEKDIKATDSPGTQKNWEASTICHEHYHACLGQCN